MPIPTTETADGKVYDFVADKTVAVGDPTEAVADHDTLAENSDYDRAQSVAGWAASECGSDYLRTVKNGKGELDFCGTAQYASHTGDDGFDIILHDRSALEIPADADLRSRFIKLEGSCIFTKASSQLKGSFMPGGVNDKYWNIDTSALGLCARSGFSLGEFWSGDGDDSGLGAGLPTKYFATQVLTLAYTGGGGTATFTAYAWVSNASPYKLCMMILKTANDDSLDGICLRCRVSYGHQWITP